MRKFGFFILGVLFGIAITIAFAYIYGKTIEKQPPEINSGLSFFDEPGERITAKGFVENENVDGFEVFQVLGKGAALATGDEWFSRDLVVLLWNESGTDYYDNQTVTAQSGECFRQIGIYKYKTVNDVEKTVPIVKLMDNEIGIHNTIENNNSNYVFFDKKGEVMSDKSYKVSRIVSEGAALARGKSEYGSSYYGLEVLLWDENSNYYDDQVVKAPNGKCFRQIGIYKSGFSTYPIVTLANSVTGVKPETKETTQKVEKPRLDGIDGNKIIEPQISTESSKTETTNPKLDKNKAYRLVRD